MVSVIRYYFNNRYCGYSKYVLMTREEQIEEILYEAHAHGMREEVFTIGI